MGVPITVAEAVQTLIATLERSELAYALGGAVALAAWSEPRATTDVDATVWIEEDELPRLFDLLERGGVAIDRAAAATQATDRGMFVGRLGGVRIDIFVPSIPFYDEAVKQRRRTRIGDQETWVLSAESLAVFKMLFFRAKDLVDVARMLELRGEAFDRGFVRRWLVDTVGADDERIRRWDELTASPSGPAS